MTFFPFTPPLLLTVFLPLKTVGNFTLTTAWELRNSGQPKPLQVRVGSVAAQPGMESQSNSSWVEKSSQQGSAVCLYSAQEAGGSCIVCCVDDSLAGCESASTSWWGFTSREGASHKALQSGVGYSRGEALGQCVLPRHLPGHRPSVCDTLSARLLDTAPSLSYSKPRRSERCEGTTRSPPFPA